MKITYNIRKEITSHSLQKILYFTQKSSMIKEEKVVRRVGQLQAAKFARNDRKIHHILRFS